MAEPYGSTSGWKSRLLGELGVTSAAVVEHGRHGSKYGQALAAALTIALGCAAPSAHASATTQVVDNAAAARIAVQYGADTVQRSAQSKIEAAAGADALAEEPSAAVDSDLRVAEVVGSVLLNPQGTILKETSRFIVGRTADAVTDSDGVGEQAANIAGAAVGVAVMSPMIGAYFVFDQARGTYAFVKEHQQQQLDAKLSQVAERVERVQAEEVMRIRLEERSIRQAQPERVVAADRAEILKMVQFFEETGFIDPALQVRIDVEQAVEKAGYATEDWYPDYVRAASPPQNNDAPKTKDRFMAGLKNLSAAIDTRESLRSSENNNLKLPGMH